MTLTITNRLRSLYFAESKPKKLTPTDLALLTYLLLRETEDHFIYDSQETLGARLGCDRRTVSASIKRLKKLGWVTVEQKWDWNPKDAQENASDVRSVRPVHQPR
jgi:DNA-binding MarR family transcriptional regulator